MSRTLPAVDVGQFAERILARCPVPLSRSAIALLYGHYTTLRKWSTRVALIGPGTVEEVFDRHYGESLAALPWIDGISPRIIDIGSGAGFPGLVLALARPGLNVALIESRLKKCTFLESSLRAARSACSSLLDDAHTERDKALSALSVKVVNARIESPLPDELPTQFDVVTSRAVRLSPGLLSPLITRQPDARYLLWLGVDRDPLSPLMAQRRHRLEGSHGRFLVEATAHHLEERAEHR